MKYELGHGSFRGIWKTLLLSFIVDIIQSMKYKTLLFDLDGTILDFSKTEEAALIAAYKIVFDTKPIDNLQSVYHKINSALWKEFEKGNIKISDLKKKRFSDLFAYFDLNANSDDFSDIYLSELGKGGYLLEGAMDILNYCKKHYRLAAITNGIGDVQRSRIRVAKIEHFFETIVISEDVGIAKPDPEIFTITLGKMELTQKDEILMIGDSLSSDILGGINAGIDTCWIKGNGDKTKDIEPTFTISNISKLKEILNQ